MNAPYIVVLGVAQDAGYPSIGCRGACCAPAWDDPAKRRFATSLGIVDPGTQKRWIIDCTPDFKDQLRLFDAHTPEGVRSCPHGIFITHAHVGHYAGLIQLGREALDTQKMPVWAMPRMALFLKENGPWNQLVELNNILVCEMVTDRPVELGDGLSVTPILVPHRGEYSETVGFRIEGPAKSALFIPDIDSWDGLTPSIEELIAGVDVAYLDATFFSADELGGRDMTQIPHPPVIETMRRLKNLPDCERAKVRLIHFNHTNPLLKADSAEVFAVREAGFNIAEHGEEIRL